MRGRGGPKSDLGHTGLRHERTAALKQLTRLGKDPYGDKPTERALRLGIRGEVSHVFSGCNWCHDLSHRRAENGCPGCGEPYEAEPAPRAIASSPQSSLFRAEQFAMGGDE